jgi:hypothetical protein
MVVVLVGVALTRKQPATAIVPMAEPVDEPLAEPVAEKVTTFK